MRGKHTFNANATNTGRHVLAEELLFVLDGWTGQDDWGMETYPYPSTVLELLGDLHAGDNPRALRLAGRALGWKANAIAKYMPHFTLREATERASYRASTS